MSELDKSVFELGLLHLIESTIFALAIFLLVSILKPRKAKDRYRFYQLAIIKFLLPIGVVVALASEQMGATTQFLEGIVVATVSSSSAYVADHAPIGWVWTVSIVWILISSFLTMAYLISVARSRQLIAKNEPLTSGGHTRVENAVRQAGFKRKLPIICDRRYTSIGLVGFFRPRMIVNATFLETLSDEELLAATKHELAHARRMDNLWRSVHDVIVAIFWFHPLVWILQRKLRHESEMACDEEALQGGENPRSYAECLLKAASFKCNYRRAYLTTFTAKSLKNRVRKIVNYENRKESMMKLLTMNLAMLCAIALISAASTSLYAGGAEKEVEGTVYRLKDLDRNPKATFQVRPVYPPELKAAGVEGFTVVEWIIDSNGRVVGPKAVKSSLEDFEEPAVTAIMGSKWIPGRKDGEAVAVRVRQRIEFSLNPQKQSGSKDKNHK